MVGIVSCFQLFRPLLTFIWVVQVDLDVKDDDLSAYEYDIVRAHEVASRNSQVGGAYKSSWVVVEVRSPRVRIIKYSVEVTSEINFDTINMN